ncbi:T9SS type A sorting domain-containing protein [Sporocytophaga myxococcoides]|uniref:T9SS type A sorting domain-containing protein n=1 Tax=Sporocytophaga myxococcoides TaxID=153721 RepID=UPI00316ACB68
MNGNGIVTILTMQGDVVKEINAEPDNKSTRVQIRDIRAGIYLLKYESEGKSFSERLVIVK